MAMIEDGRRLSAIEHSQALLARGPFYDQARRFFETCDLLLTPQMPLAAWSADPDTSGVTIDGLHEDAAALRTEVRDALTAQARELVELRTLLERSRGTGDGARRGGLPLAVAAMGFPGGGDRVLSSASRRARGCPVRRTA